MPLFPAFCFYCLAAWILLCIQTSGSGKSCISVLNYEVRCWHWSCRYAQFGPLETISICFTFVYCLVHSIDYSKSYQPWSSRWSSPPGMDWESVDWHWKNSQLQWRLEVPALIQGAHSRTVAMPSMHSAQSGGPVTWTLYLQLNI